MWTQERTLRIIELWHQLPVLWDTKHKHYRNRDARKNALEILAAEFEMTAMDIEKKITGLKNQYRREYNKLHYQDPSSFSVEWFGYRPLQFIQTALFTREPNSRYDSSSHFLELKDFETPTSDLPSTSGMLKIKEEIDISDLPSQLKEINNTEAIVLFDPNSQNSSNDIEVPQPRASKRLKSQHNSHPTTSTPLTIAPPQILNIFARVNEDDNFPEIQSSNSQQGNSLEQLSPSPHQPSQQIQSRPQSRPPPPLSTSIATPEETKEQIISHIPDNRDEFTVYAEYVANSLRKFNDQHSVLVAQNKINNILFDGATGMFALYSSDRRECTSTRRDFHNKN